MLTFSRVTDGINAADFFHNLAYKPHASCWRWEREGEVYLSGGNAAVRFCSFQWFVPFLMTFSPSGCRSPPSLGWWNDGCTLSKQVAPASHWSPGKDSQLSLWLSGLACLCSAGHLGATCSFSCLVNHSDATAGIHDCVLIAQFIMSRDIEAFWIRTLQIFWLLRVSAHCHLCRGNFCIPPGNVGWDTYQYLKAQLCFQFDMAQLGRTCFATSGWP